MNTPTKELEKTAILSGNETGRKKTRRNNPKLFVCCGTDIFMYDLDGEQMIGRPTGQSTPDLPIINEYVSKEHGRFFTEDGRVRFVANKTTNGTLYADRFLRPGEEVSLRDGDELRIPTFSDNRHSHIHLIAALSDNRIGFWKEMSYSSHDALTDLPKRGALTAWLINGKHFLKSGEELVIGFMDVDDFKQVNDRYGHLAGDKALRLIGEVLGTCMSENGIACRWGGDEFVFAFIGNGRRRGNRIEQIREMIAESARKQGMPLSVSIGFTRIQKDNPERVDDWIRQADRMLYLAKEKGKNLVCEYGIDRFE